MSGKRTADTTCRGSWIKGSRQVSKFVQAAAIAVCVTTAGAGLVFNGYRDAIAAAPTVANSSSLEPDLEPLDLSALDPAKTPVGLITAASISLTHLTIPSLWWLQEEIASNDAYGGKLLANWLAYPNDGNHPGRVDLVVNRQFWSLLDYLDRYAFIHAFGKAARDYGYNVRVFDGQATLLGASTCDFSTINIDAMQSNQLSKRASEPDRLPLTMTSSLPPNPTDSIACSILLDSSGKGGLRGGSSPLSGGGAAKAFDTHQP